MVTGGTRSVTDISFVTPQAGNGEALFNNSVTYVPTFVQKVIPNSPRSRGLS